MSHGYIIFNYEFERSNYLKEVSYFFVCCSINNKYCYKYAKYTIIGDVYHCICNTKVNRACTITLNFTFFEKSKRVNILIFSGVLFQIGLTH
jgi:ubiquinone biosynthesis protein Coq4